MAKKNAKFTAEELEIISHIQSERGTARKSAVRYFQKNRDQYMRKNTKSAATPAHDFKAAAANDREEVSAEIRAAEEGTGKAKTAALRKAAEANTPKLPAKNASATAKGAAYAVLAGRPSKDAVVAAFGKTGYALSWVARAERLGIAVEDLCQRFRDNAAQVKQQWAALTAQKEAARA